VSTVSLEHGQVLIWHPRYDDRYMHALHFPNEDLAKQAESFFPHFFFFRWVVGVGDYYIEGPKDGYPVKQETLGEVVVQMGSNEEFEYDD
jgi:hypothetical protein